MNGNARAVMVDKVKTPKPTGEPRMTFNYSRIVEELAEIWLPLHKNRGNF